ncbi:MAG TPA: hypothetical protein VMQ93_16220 [Novosphingobium sp.]|nr:hypothetical protein [Novosphingobium sp.]
MLAPQEFELPRYAEGGWIIGKHHFTENPRYTVPASLLRLCRRWLEIRTMGAAAGGSMITVAGAPVMPRAGGYMDQTAFVMDAFRLFDGWLQERKEDG